MKSLLSIAVLTIGLLPIVLAEPPVLYGAPAFSGPSSFGGSGGGSGGGYHATNLGHQSTEGLFVDPHLLHKIKDIILGHEAHEEQHRHHSYAPSTAYGVPHHYERVAGIEFGGIRPAIQVAQFHQVSHEHHSYAPSHGYAAPSYYPASPPLAYGPPHH